MLKYFREIESYTGTSNGSAKGGRGKKAIYSQVKANTAKM